MKELIEVTGSDISLLHDDDLRSLIGRLCEADYRSMRLSTKGIKWGGHQDASDGGLDVVVRSDISPPVNSYIPRNNSGFQVKKPKMPSSEIIKEMKPKGILRDEIKSLIQCGGAYIIVSSSDSTTDSMLKDRINAMRNAIKDEDGHEKLYIDFYDCGQIATWLRDHPSLILWVRNKIERPMRGWHSYENWARTPGGIEEEYLLDDGLRMYDESSATHTNRVISIKDGINKFRSILSLAGKCLRLVGLSGVGKTRLVQALFDNRIGENCLNLSQVFYTDISANPEPDPVFMAEQLISSKAVGVLIVDNCQPDLHRRLTKICSESKSTISLLTIEYDVRDDLPEETSIFRLEPSSDETIEKIVKIHFSHISHVDARTIANFSGGNARIAIALASTVQKGETLSGFRDEELFKRLFTQRNESDENLLISAQVLSLVYSFEGVDYESENSELKVLASLIEISASMLYRHVDVLIKRGLIQSRSVWRAVLPPAIADRLAKLALDSIPKDKIVRTLLNNGSERLIRSFTRRLGYLHDNNKAVLIADELLASQGWLGKENCKFSDFGIQVFKNIAPVVPEKTLIAIERAAKSEGVLFTSRENPHFYEIVGILWHLAYDQNLFDRCTKLISRFALSETPHENNNSIRKFLNSLFYIHYSGTHASVEAREKIILELLESDNEDESELGLSLLDTALETMYFSPIHNFEFGARPRDSGYHPKSLSEVTFWYEKFISICTKLALSNQSIAVRARNILSKNLRGLWGRGQVVGAIENSATLIHENKTWNEGWLSVRETMQQDSKLLSEVSLEKLKNLEKILRPNNLIEFARVCIFSPLHKAFSIDDDFYVVEDISCRLKRTEDTTQKIGMQVAQDFNTFDILLPEFFSNEATRLHSFGKGLAEGADDRKQLWEKLYAQFSILPSESIMRIDVLLGFLSFCAEKKINFYNQILDNAVTDPHLCLWLPILETSSTINQYALLRLHKSLDNNKIEINYFKYIAYGRAHESISDDDLASLLKKMLSKNGGIEVVIEILKMRFHKQNKSSNYSINLIEVAREALSLYLFPEENKHNNIDYYLGQIGGVCLSGENGKKAAIEISKNFLKSCMNTCIYAMNYPHMLDAIAYTQPRVFLDYFINAEIIEKYHRTHIFFTHGNPLDQISEEELVSWCEVDPSTRYTQIASVINVFTEVDDQKSELKFNSKLLTILNKAPNVSSFFEKMSNSIWCCSGWGTREDTLERQLSVLLILCEHNNLEVCSRAKELCASIEDAINQERSWLSQSNHQYESFE